MSIAILFPSVVVLFQFAPKTKSNISNFKSKLIGFAVTADFQAVGVSNCKTTAQNRE